VSVNDSALPRQSAHAPQRQQRIGKDALQVWPGVMLSMWPVTPPPGPVLVWLSVAVNKTPVNSPQLLRNVSQFAMFECGILANVHVAVPDHVLLPPLALNWP